MTRGEVAGALLIYALLALLLSAAVEDPDQLVPLSTDAPDRPMDIGGGEVVASGSIGGMERIVLHEGELTDPHDALAPGSSIGRRDPRTLID